MSMTTAPAQLQMEQALDEMLQRRNGRVVRWTRQPELVVLTSVMEYRPGAQTTYEATSEVLGEQEINDLIGDLTTALRLLTADTFKHFAVVRLEDAPSGTRVNVLRPGQIVVGRYLGLRDRLNTVGLGGKVAYDAASVGAGLILLDRDYDRRSSLRRLLRTHELGHALGYRHVESSSSIMNPRIGSEPTDVDRRAALVAFEGMAAAPAVSCPTS
jgi:matrixin